MANPEHIAILSQGVDIWNRWRQENRSIVPDFSQVKAAGAYLKDANLSGANLQNADFTGANLAGANLTSAVLKDANLSNAYLVHAELWQAKLVGTNLSNTNFYGASLWQANLVQAVLIGAELSNADVSQADLSQANLSKSRIWNTGFSRSNLNQAKLIGAEISNANFMQADLSMTDFENAFVTNTDFSLANLMGVNFINTNLRQSNFWATNLTDANLTNAVLEQTVLIDTILERANLNGCFIFGISAWNVNLKNATQSNLTITRYDEPQITVDNLQIAQFIYLLLNNSEVRHVIDTVTSKAVLILGRFTDSRKGILDAIRNELRHRDYLPIVFDFDKPNNRDLTETIITLAGMSRFVIADLSDPHSIPHELMSFVEKLPSVPVKPIFCSVEAHPKPYSMLEHFKHYHWVLDVYEYDNLDQLMPTLVDQVIAPAEAKVKELRSGKP